MIGWEGSSIYPTVGLISLAGSAVTWVVPARQKDPAVSAWCWGRLLIAAGLALSWMAVQVWGWQQHSTADVLVIGGILLCIQAVRMEQGAPWPSRWLAAVALAWVGAYGLIRMGLGGGNWLDGFVSLAWLLLVGQVAWWAWRIFRQRTSRGALTIAAAQTVLACGLLVHLVDLIQAATRSGSGPPMLGVLGLGTVGATTVLLSDAGFVGIVFDKVVRQGVEAAESRARMEERQVLGHQLVVLDRQRGFGLVAASLAHELKQPLTAILASAQAAQRGADRNRLAPEQSHALLDKVIHNARRMAGIMERFRTFIRPAALNPGPVDLGQVVRDVLDLLEPDLRRHRVQVAFPAMGPVVVAGDAIQLSQVLLNVLRNALEAVAARPERSIRIQLTPAGTDATLTIQDTGPGLAPGLAERVGQPHVTTKAGGLGLGLSISVAILHQHHGSLALATAPEGGARAEIRLPLLQGGRGPASGVGAAP